MGKRNATFFKPKKKETCKRLGKCSKVQKKKKKGQQDVDGRELAQPPNSKAGSLPNPNSRLKRGEKKEKKTILG